ncbi:MAG: hypothetical protein ACQGVC_24120 [Myxococcota bacterium]
MRAFCLLLSLSLLLACAESARDQLASARQALAESKYDIAVETADAGLAAGGDEVTTWGLELVRLEALARAGAGEAALAQLEKLAAERPDQVGATQYAATADQLRTAEQGAAAIQVLDAGLKRFPKDTDLLALIEDAKAAPAAGSEELDMLRSLGYVE